MSENFNLIHPGLGCTLSYSTSSGGSYTTVGQLKSLGGTSFEGIVVDSTGINSTAVEQTPIGLFKGGDYSCEIWLNMGDATHQALLGYLGTTTILFWKQTFSAIVGQGATATTNNATYAFSGGLNGFETTGYDHENGITATIKIAINGEVTATNPS